MKKGEPWYIHAALGVVIAVLVYVLIRVAIVDPSEHVAQEKYFTEETRLRMDNLRQAQILWEKKNDLFSGSIDTLVNFIRTDSTVHQLITGIDSMTLKSSNPFKVLTNSPLDLDSLKNVPDQLLAQILSDTDSLFLSPKSLTRYILEVDTSIQIDTILTRRGKIGSIDTIITIGERYYIECPDGYGSIGSLTSDALRNTATWE